jgi:hypothetical protein
VLHACVLRRCRMFEITGVNQATQSNIDNFRKAFLMPQAHVPCSPSNRRRFAMLADSRPKLILDFSSLIPRAGIPMSRMTGETVFRLNFEPYRAPIMRLYSRWMRRGEDAGTIGQNGSYEGLQEEAPDTKQTCTKSVPINGGQGNTEWSKSSIDGCIERYQWRQRRLNSRRRQHQEAVWPLRSPQWTTHSDVDGQRSIQERVCVRKRLLVITAHLNN